MMLNQAHEARLIADIGLANNGYLIAKYLTRSMQETAFAMELQGKVSITHGLIHLPKFKPEFFQTELPKRAFPMRHDGPDYEALILNRQDQFCD